MNSAKGTKTARGGQCNRTNSRSDYTGPVPTPAILTENQFDPCVSNADSVRNKSISIDQKMLMNKKDKRMATKLQRVPNKPIGYYYVDDDLKTRSEKRVNGPWLKSLCSQPVQEIFGKYHRKADAGRADRLWYDSEITPGQQAIVDAWATQDGSNISSAHALVKNTSTTQPDTSLDKCVDETDDLSPMCFSVRRIKTACADEFYLPSKDPARRLRSTPINSDAIDPNVHGCPSTPRTEMSIMSSQKSSMLKTNNDVIKLASFSPTVRKEFYDQFGHKRKIYPKECATRPALMRSRTNNFSKCALPYIHCASNNQSNEQTVPMIITTPSIYSASQLASIKQNSFYLDKGFSVYKLSGK